MKTRYIVFVLLVSSIFLLNGCKKKEPSQSQPQPEQQQTDVRPIEQKQTAEPSEQPEEKGFSKVIGNVKVSVDGADRFPENLAGHWKANRGSWEFVIEPNGGISYAAIDAGIARINPNITNFTVPLKDGGTGTYELGQWTLYYSAQNGNMTLEVIIDGLNLVMEDFGIKGTSRDVFFGPVSEDATEWQAEWFSFPDHVAYGDGENIQFSFDPNKNPVDVLTFTKEPSFD